MSAVRHAICVLGCLVLAGVPATATAAASPAAGPAANAPAHPATGARADKALAETDARATLGELQLPPGASASATEPAGDGGQLALPSGWPSRRGTVKQHAWWTVPGPPAQVLEYLHTHLPPQASWYGYPQPPVTNTGFAQLRWPPGAGVIAEQWLDIRVAQLASGQTGVIAEALVLWVGPRAPIPLGSRVLRVTADSLRGMPRHTRHRYSFTAPRLISRVRALINSLPIARPTLLVRSCPAGFGTVRLDFLPRRASTPLATVTLAVGGCGGISLTVRGREQPGLQDRGFLLGRLARTLSLPLESLP